MKYLALIIVLSIIAGCSVSGLDRGRLEKWCRESNYKKITCNNFERIIWPDGDTSRIVNNADSSIALNVRIKQHEWVMRYGDWIQNPK